MKRVRPSRLLALTASILALQGCVQNTVIPVTLEGYVLTSANRVIGFGTADASRAIISTTITGLAAGETLLDIDFRSSEGKLYALSSAGKVYDISSSSVATLISTLTADPADTSSPFTALSTTARYTLDVDPVQDRLRVIGSNGDNLKVDMNTGLTTTDTSVTAGTVGGLASTDVSTAGSGRSTALYGIDTGTDAVYLINPSTGVQTVQATLGVDATSILGYDIGLYDGKGYAMMTVGGSNGLYRIDETGATPVAKRLSGVPAMFSGERIVGIAMLAPLNPTVIALDNSSGSSTLRQFAARAPDTLGTALSVTGLATGETLLGIDERATDGKLYGLGSTGKIYSIADSGAATAVGPTLTLTSGHSYLIEMNPLATTTAPLHKGLVHVIDKTGLQQVTVDIENNTTNAPVNITPATVNLGGSAFSANYSGATGTSQFVADLTSATLATLSTSTGSVAAYLATGLSLSSAAGLDISGHGDQNILLAGRTTAGSGPSTLYQLGTAGAVALGVIGGSSGPVISDIAIRY